MLPLSEPHSQDSVTCRIRIKPNSVTGLRHKLVLLERPSEVVGEDNVVTLDVPAIDAALAGGLARGTVHEISAHCEAHTVAASRFALALVERLKQSCRVRRATRGTGSSAKAIVWIAQDLCLFENGVPYGPGLVDLGIAPEQLITVAAPRIQDVLWAMEEALRCRATAVVIGEIGPQKLDQVATRRLSLAAAAGGTLGLLLRATLDDATPCACATRWIIGSAPSAVLSGNGGKFRSIGPPRLCVHLVRNRHGHPGAWLVEWNSVEQRFELATDSVSVAAAAIDRPPHAVVA
jgi:protein ImuA